MTHIFPYYTLGNKCFFRYGVKRLVAIIDGYDVRLEGDIINKILDIPMKKTVHLDRYKLKYNK